MQLPCSNTVDDTVGEAAVLSKPLKTLIVWLMAVWLST